MSPLKREQRVSLGNCVSGKSGNDIFPQAARCGPPNDVRASQGRDTPRWNGCDAMKNWMMAFPLPPPSPTSVPGRGDVADRTQRGTRETPSLHSRRGRRVVRGNATAKKPFSFTMSACGERARQKKKKGKRGKKEKSGGEKERVDYSGIHE